MLRMCYQSEVERRNMKYVSDEATLEKIGKAAKFLCGNGKFGLLLYGTVGSGKTTLAKAICNIIGILYNSDLSSERKGVYRISALNLAKSIADDPTYFNKLKNQELLFIDDVGTEPASVKSWGNEFSPVTELIYARYDRQLFTIATSNLADEEFGDRYGERIADRMEEMFERLHYSQKSYRKGDLRSETKQSSLMLSVKRITTNLLQALIAFNLTTRPIAIIGTRRYKKKCWICQVVPTRIRHFRLPL